jgi:hypothetical protein
MEKTENTLSLITKIEELKKEFKKDFNYNKFESKLVLEVNQYLSQIIQSEIESLMHDRRFLSILYVVAGKQCLKVEGYRMVCVTILNGQGILISAPYFYNRAKGDKARRKQARSKGNNIDCHLGLTLIGMISRFSGNLASEICKMALLCPSNKMAVKLMSDRGVEINNKTLRKVVRDVGQIGLSLRGEISISNKENIEGKTLVIGTDGGRIRERHEKKWENRKGAKRKGYNTDWKEPVLFTMYLTDEKGEIDKGFVPLYDATMQDKDYIFTLIGKYLGTLGCKKLSRIVFVGDGAPWIWARVEKLFKEYFQETPTYQILDYTHAKQALNEILDLLPKKCQEREKITALFKQRLWDGNIEGMEKMIRINYTGQCRKKALNKWDNYFQKNKERMQYSTFKVFGLPQGSGTVESAIRRVINLRLKSCGSFWKKENAEIYLFLRAQLISGRWNIYFNNLIKRMECTEYQFNVKSNSYMEWAA